MRYFLYINGPDKQTAVVVDEGSDTVKVFPPGRINHCSVRKSDWIDYYDRLNEEGRKTSMFEICENQFKKFAEKGIVPECHDAYFVAQRRIKA